MYIGSMQICTWRHGSQTSPTSVRTEALMSFLFWLWLPRIKGNFNYHVSLGCWIVEVSGRPLAMYQSPASEPCSAPGQDERSAELWAKLAGCNRKGVSRNQIPGWNFLFWLCVVGMCRLCPLKSGIRWSPSMRNCPRLYSWNLFLRHQSQTHTVIFARVIDKMTFLLPSTQVIGAEVLVKTESEIHSLNQPWHVELRRFNQWSDVAVPFLIFSTPCPGTGIFSIAARAD